jgi:hypothetical protein
MLFSAYCHYAFGAVLRQLQELSTNKISWILWLLSKYEAVPSANKDRQSINSGNAMRSLHDMREMKVPRDGCVYLPLCPSVYIFKSKIT